MLAAYFVQAAMPKNGEAPMSIMATTTTTTSSSGEEDLVDGREASVWMQDPDELEVLAAVEEDERLAEEYDELVNWHREDHPIVVKIVLVTGSLFASATVYILVNPVHKAFAKFSLTDKVSELPNASVLDVVHPTGYVSLATLAVSVVLVGVYQAWCAWATRPSQRCLIQLAGAPSCADREQQNKVPQQAFGPDVEGAVLVEDSGVPRVTLDMPGGDFCFEACSARLASDNVAV